MINNKLIMVGGNSGTGKTTLVETLIDLYPDFYARPISFTTRKKRRNENGHEYIFVSKEEFESLDKSNKLLNSDYVYNNYYGIDKKSVNEIMGKCKKNPIKEIHPKNHQKIKNSIKKNAISVLITSNFENKFQNTRYNEDNDYYCSISMDDFDIVFNNDKNTSILQNAKDLHIKIKAVLNAYDTFPSSGKIDLINREGYNKIASCFTEDKRITTRNFHQLTQTFFLKFFSEYIHSYSNVLEIGPGNGWLINTVNPICGKYTCLDISNKMSINHSIDMVISSVRYMPFSSRFFDVVVASLADPYLYPEAICEINRILKPGGYFAFSTPSKEWAVALRGDSKENNKTKFVSDDHEEISVYSFTYSNEELNKIMEMTNFTKVSLSSIKGKSLTGNISPAIINAAQNIKIDYRDLNIITIGIFQRKD